MSRKRSYVEALENGEIEHLFNQNSLNATQTETVPGFNDSDSVEEVFFENTRDLNSKLHGCEESLNNESYIKTVNECNSVITVPLDKDCQVEDVNSPNCELKNKKNSKENIIVDVCNNSSAIYGSSECSNNEEIVNDIDLIPVMENNRGSENSLGEIQEIYSEKTDRQFEMNSIKSIDGSSVSSQAGDDEDIQFRRDNYLDSNGKFLHAVSEPGKLDAFGDIDYSDAIDSNTDNDVLNNVDDYVAQTTIERFSNNFVNDSQFENGIFTEADNVFASDPSRYDLIEVDQEIGDNTNMNDSSFQDDNTNGEDKFVFPIQYTGRNSVRKSKKKAPQNQGFRAQKWRRVIFRSGQANIPSRLHLPRRAAKYMNDLVTTLVDGQWRWVIFLLSVCHFVIWLGFGLMFYVASYANGDMSENPPAIPCITEGRTFTGIFTYAVETQVSIGYGEKSPTEACPEVIFIMVMEVVAGYLLIGGMVGIVYTKLMRPAKHLKGVGFSKNAVVCLRDGRLCLVVRVWDIMQKHVMSTRVTGWFIKHTTTGPVNYSLSLSPGTTILWPTTLQHTIDKDSPLFDMSAKDLIDTRFEIVISVVGACRLTGNMTQSRTSYLPHDVLWGHRFKRILNYSPTEKCYVADMKSLNSLENVDTPLCSARLLYELNSDIIDGSAKASISPLYLSPPGSPLSILNNRGFSFQHIPKLVRERSL